MSNIDIRIILPEVQSVAIGAFVKNVYQFDDVFVLKLYKPAEGTTQLLIQPGVRVHLTEFRRNAPKIPPKFCQALRKYIKDKRIIAIEQHDLDRIVTITIGDDEAQYKLVIEVFGNGNLLLLDPDERIFIAMRYKRMRDREVIPKALYEFPPQRGLDIFHLDRENLEAMIKGSKANIVRTLASRLNLDALSCQEICALAGVSPTSIADSLSENDIKDLLMGVGIFIEKVNHGANEPVIVLNESEEDEEPIAFLPFPFEIYAEFPTRAFSTYSNAIDEFFGVTETEETDVQSDALARERAKLQRIIEKQQESVTRLNEKAERLQRTGELIYSHFQVVQDVLDTIRQARTRGLAWSDILQTIEAGKQKGNTTAMLIERIIPSKAQIIIKLEGTDVSLDLRLSAQDNASKAYQEAKKARSKMQGAHMQIEKTKEKLANLESIVIEPKVERRPVKIRKRRWYEKYRWFISSEGFLVLGGRDAKTNEQLAKRQLEPNDVFLHAAIHGAPYVVIKVPEEPPGEQTLREAAQFAVTFSRAWQDGLSAGDAYWVSPEQVSFSPPTGEYLPAGAVMIYGSKNYIKRVPVELAVGVMIRGDETTPVSGPPSAIQALTEYFALVEPGDTKKGQFIKELISYLKHLLPDDDQQYLAAIPPDEFGRVLPTGGCRLKN